MATAVTSETQLPREMMEHTYPILFEVEGTHWWYIGRRRIMAFFLREIVERLGRRPRIADVGCGTGANLLLLQEFGDVTGIDISDDALSFCRERGLDNVRLGSAEELPLDDGSIDLLTAFDVVEHLDDDAAGLREFHRVLKPDGRILLFVPAFMFLWGVQDDVSNHRRRYTMPELLDVVLRAGFEVERSSYVNITFFVPIFLVRWFMRLTGVKTDSENRINISALNGIFARVFSFESRLLRLMNFPFGVSAVCVARRV